MVADDRNQADTGLTKAKELVENQHVQMLAGLVATPTCYAVAEYAKQAQEPALVTGQCSAQGLTIDPKAVSPYLVRLTSTSVQTNDPAADWAYNKGYRKGIINKVEEAFAALELIEDGKLESAVFTGLGVRGARAVVQAARPPGGPCSWLCLLLPTAKLGRAARLVGRLAVLLNAPDGQIHEDRRVHGQRDGLHRRRLFGQLENLERDEAGSDGDGQVLCPELAKCEPRRLHRLKQAIDQRRPGQEVDLGGG